MTRTLRPYQLEAVQAVQQGWADGINRQAVVLPTGAGKTDVIAKIAADAVHQGRRVLVLAHREELLGQISERVGMHDPAITVGRAQGDRMEPRRQVICGMVQTLVHERRRLQLLKPGLVVVDECHHACSPSYVKVLEWAGCFDQTPTMGVTATMARAGRPKRGERGLGDIWSSVAFQRDIAWAVDAGWLVRPRGRTVVTDHMDLSKVKVVAGDYRDGELGELVTQDVEQIVGAWLEHAGERTTMAFTPNIASATALRDAFAGAGVKAEMVIGSTSIEERQAIHDRLSTGVTRVRVDVMVGTEGYDCPAVSCILMARPTKSTGLYQQMVGRGLRRAADKQDCLVLDVVGASRVNGLATLLQLYRGAEADDERPELYGVERCDLCALFLRGQHLPPGSAVCRCDAEMLARDPDGGRRKLEGPARYVEHDLFEGPGHLWQTTRRKGRIFLAVADRFAVLWPEPDGSWTAAHCAASGASGGARNPFGIVDLRVGVSMAEAKLVAEAWARSYGGADLARRAAERARYRRAAPYLLARAARFKVANAEGMSAARVEEECDRAVASSRLDLL